LREREGAKSAKYLFFLFYFKDALIVPGKYLTLANNWRVKRGISKCPIAASRGIVHDF
jgi:hypothetical protein